jgi:hypothetical protein
MILVLALVMTMGNSVRGDDDTPTAEQQKKIDVLVKEITPLKTGMSFPQTWRVCKHIVMGKKPTEGYEAFGIKLKDGKPEALTYKWGRLQMESDGKIGFIGPIVNGQMALVPKGSKTIKANDTKLSMLVFRYDEKEDKYYPWLFKADKGSTQGQASYTRGKDEMPALAYLFVE